MTQLPAVNRTTVAVAGCCFVYWSTLDTFTSQVSTTCLYQELFRTSTYINKQGSLMSTLCIVLQVVNIAMLVFDVQHYWQIQQCDLALCQMSTDY